MAEPRQIGVLTAQQGKGKRTFSFEYEESWIQSAEQVLLDPDLTWFPGPQFPSEKENFGVFLDSMPDTWGRTLMKRRAAFKARDTGKPAQNFYETDYLLGVHDNGRMGALRFKLDKGGAFLDDDPNWSAPPIANIRELQYAAEQIENDDDTLESRKWLSVLIAPGSSLGGARPKANIRDSEGNLWIAKFPSKNDSTDKAAWEYLAYRLAVNAGVQMSDSYISKISGRYHSFFTRRFDRQNHERIHFASAMTMTGNDESVTRTKVPSYLDIADFIEQHGSNVNEDLEQLWRRIVFNIAVSNTDDHLRNHGFILGPEGWRLSPAYDLNPSTDKNGLALNIDTDSNELDFELAESVGEFFRLNKRKMTQILNEVKSAVSGHSTIANEIGISRQEQEIMQSAFRT
ncbi:MAG: HipA domain-containing protein [Bacteroidota bacterium]